MARQSFVQPSSTWYVYIIVPTLLFSSAFVSLTVPPFLLFIYFCLSQYEDDLGSQTIWWNKWEKFMFDTKLKIKDKSGEVKELAIWQMLQKIKRSKYPEVSEQEEEDSLPLQTMCGAIFDAILVHM
jgi:hypothetical protein